MEKELINRSKKGDSEAFTHLVKSIQNDLYRIAKTRLNNDYDINDAIQETMINAYKHIKKLKNNEMFKSWIIRILINECNQIYNKKVKNKKLVDKVNNSEILYNNSDYIQSSISNMDFEILIQELNYDERLIITLFYNSNYSYEEISNILHMNIGTVKSKISRAKDKIRKKYKGGIINGK